MTDVPHLLVVESPYYKDIAAELYRGAKQALDAAGVTHDGVSVPGVLEIPAAISMALETSMDDNRPDYDGFIALGCVIRGETTHYDVVAGESARALMDLSVEFAIPLGNGIQTVENEAQAWARAKVDDKNKGGGAAEAALAMIKLRKAFGG